MNRSPVNAEEMHALLEQEVRNLRSSEEWVRWLDAATNFPRYSFRNLVLITLQMPQASRVAGYHAWKKLGRRVMKNQRGIKIIAPVLARPKAEARVDGTAQQKEISEAVASVRSRGQVVGYRLATVWDVTQTVGPPIPELPRYRPAIGAVPTGLWDALAREVASNGFILRRSSDAGSEGYTDYTDREIVVADHLDDQTAVSRLAHEVAHMRMHSTSEEVGSTLCRGVREVEAESVAYILLAHHGLRSDGSSFPYVASWAATVDQNEPEKVVEVTGARVVTFARELIESTDRHLMAGAQADRATRQELSPRGLVLPVPPQIDVPGL